MSYCPERILTGAPNARDLGGLETADGHRLKSRRLIRSGMLRTIDNADVEYLKSVGLKKVIDLRTDQELIEKPDIIIDGVEYIHCPLLPNRTDGITREGPKDEFEEAERTVMMAHRLMKKSRDGRVAMGGLYPVLVSEEFSIDHLAEFFGILLESDEGCVLYHCSMGKDRVGTATALLLSALGVPRESIMSDYLITNERCATGTRRLIENCRRYTDDEAVLEFIYHLDRVDAPFLQAVFDTVDRLYGGVDAFLRDRLGLGDSGILRLRELYLDQVPLSDEALIRKHIG